MKLFSFLAFNLILISLFGQHTTMRFTDSPINLNQQSVLIIPFESHYYLSDVNRTLARSNQLTTDEIISRFTNAIDQSLLYAFEEKCTVNSFYLLDDEESKTDLAYLFKNRKLEYELLEKTEEESKLKKFSKAFQKKQDESYQSGGIENGQVVTKRDVRERYMKAVIKDGQVLDSISSKFENDYFLFVNELDINTLYGDALDMQTMQYDREIKIHYTLYHRDGSILSTGISKTTFPSSQNDINEIIKGYFPILAKQIFEALFPPEEDAEKSK